jgi:hypothetical protein
MKELSYENKINTVEMEMKEKESKIDRLKRLN